MTWHWCHTATIPNPKQPAAPGCNRQHGHQVPLGRLHVSHISRQSRLRGTCQRGRMAWTAREKHTVLVSWGSTVLWVLALNIQGFTVVFNGTNHAPIFPSRTQPLPVRSLKPLGRPFIGSPLFIAAVNFSLGTPQREKKKT